MKSLSPIVSEIFKNNHFVTAAAEADIDDSIISFVWNPLSLHWVNMKWTHKMRNRDVKKTTHFILEVMQLRFYGQPMWCAQFSRWNYGQTAVYRRKVCTESYCKVTKLKHIPLAELVAVIIKGGVCCPLNQHRLPFEHVAFRPITQFVGVLVSPGYDLYEIIA